MVQQHSPDGTILGFQRAVMMNPHGAEGRAYRLEHRHSPFAGVVCCQCQAQGPLPATAISCCGEKRLGLHNDRPALFTWGQNCVGYLLWHTRTACIMLGMGTMCHHALPAVCRLWMTEVLQPLNERAATIIFDHIDLLESSTIIPELLQLVAHMATSRVMLQR